MNLITKPRMWVYHAETCRDGRIVWQEEGEVMLREGWVKTPNEFNASVISDKAPLVNDQANAISQEISTATEEPINVPRETTNDDGTVAVVIRPKVRPPKGE